jgi:hypothetical protein
MSPVRERRAFICERCYEEGRPLRVFLLPGVAVPLCPSHRRRLTQQPNVPYLKTAKRSS